MDKAWGKPNVFDEVLSKAREDAIRKGTWDQDPPGGPGDPGPPNETKFSKTAHKMVLECAAYDPDAFKTLGIQNFFERAWNEAEKRRGIKPRWVGYIVELAARLKRSERQTRRDWHNLEKHGWIETWSKGKPARVNPLTGIRYPKKLTIFVMPWNVKDRKRQIITATIEARKKVLKSSLSKTH